MLSNKVASLLSLFFLTFVLNYSFGYKNDWMFRGGSLQGRSSNGYVTVEVEGREPGFLGLPAPETKTIRLKKGECKNFGFYYYTLSYVEPSGGCITVWEKFNCNGGDRVEAKGYHKFDGWKIQEEWRSVSASCASEPKFVAQVTLYQTEGYGGTTMVVNLGSNKDCVDVSNELNDIVSAVKVTRGCVLLWEGKGCGGHWSYPVSADISAIPYTWDEEVSSVSTCDYHTSYETQVTLYDDYDYKGQSITVPLKGQECVNIHGPTKYNFNDRASSVIVSKGCVKLWHAINCGVGEHKSAWYYEVRDSEPIRKLPNNRNNHVSSVQRCSGVEAE